jgi:hypothetical protein
VPFDLSHIFEEWAHHPSDDSRNVRAVQGNDGRLKVQVRVRCGVFQWEYEGRPDGTRPYGYPSLLDFYRDRVEEVRRQGRPASSLRLSKSQAEEITQEIMDYYQRRVIFFRLGEYARARTDAEHNLALMDILRDHAEDSEAFLQHEKWRAFVMMDRARADALASCQPGSYPEAIRKLDQGIDEIADYFRRQGREDLVELSQEIAALRDLKLQLRENYSIPLSRSEILLSLREEQAKAIADEDYERAARLRDEISQYEADEPSENR